MRFNKEIIQENMRNVVKNYRVYVGIILFFLAWMLFFDEYNWIRIHREKQKLKNLKMDLHYYRDKTHNDRDKLYQLRTDSETLERFAREQYHLKKKNEEIYIIIEE